MQRSDKVIWEKELTEFLSTELAEVPDTVSAQVLANVHQELNPSSIKVFTKVAFIQFAVGLFTLLFCPQFGISFTSSMGVMPYLMKYGDGVCMVGCGTVFTALSLLIAAFSLKPEEIRVLKQHEVLQLISIATLSLGAFLCVGGEIVLTLGLAWLAGAVVGGLATLELGWLLRRKLAWRATN